MVISIVVVAGGVGGTVGSPVVVIISVVAVVGGDAVESLNNKLSVTISRANSAPYAHLSPVVERSIEEHVCIGSNAKVATMFTTWLGLGIDEVGMNHFTPIVTGIFWAK